MTSQSIERIGSRSLEVKDTILPEVHRRSNRIVVYGTNADGGGQLTIDFRRYLEEAGIENPSVELVRDVTLIRAGFFGIRTSAEERTLPRGVVTFPDMRQYGPGANMTVDTYRTPGSEAISPIDIIEELCTQYEIPLVRFEKLSTERAIRESLRTLLLPNPNKP